MRRFVPWIVVPALLGLALVWLARAPAQREVAAPGTDALPQSAAPIPAPEPAPITPTEVGERVDPDQREPVADAAALVEADGEPAVLAGRVLDQDGEPVPEVGLVLNPLDDAARAAAGRRATCTGGPTDAGGHFSMPVERAGRWCVTAQGPSLVECVGVEVDLGVRPLPDLVVPVRIGGLVTGSVRWENGRVPSGFRVRAKGPDGEATTLGRHGRFALRVRGARVQLYAYARRGGVLAEATLPDVEPGEVELVLVPAPVARVRGRVVDLDGQPQPGASVRAVGSTRPDEPRETFADGVGSFDFDLDPGEWRLSARSEGHLSIEEALRLEAPGVEGLELRVGSPAWVAGAVVDADGRGVGRASVLAAWDPSELSSLLARDSTTARADGSFELPIGTSPIWLQARAPDGRTSFEEYVVLEPGQRLDGRVLTIRERATLHGRVAGGRALGGVLLRLWTDGSGAGRSEHLVLVDAEGRFLCEGLSAGPASALVGTGDDQLLALFQLAAGWNELELELEPIGLYDFGY